MNNQALKLLSLPLLTGALCFSACSEKSETSAESAAAEFKIPEAPDAAIQYVVREISKGNGAALWQAMPASYQSDVNVIAQLAGTKIDAEIYNKIFSLVGRIGGVLDKQQEFIFNTGLSADGGNEEQLAQIRASWPSIINLVEALTTSSISSAEGLQNFEGQAFFSETVSALLLNIDALAKLEAEREEPLLSDLIAAEVKYLEGTDTAALLEMSIPGQEVETQSFVKVEDRWVPQEMSDLWTTQMAEARVQLEAVNPDQMAQQKPQILSIFAMIEGVLTQIEAAETQEQFDQALQGAMMPVMGLMMMSQGMGESGGMPPSMPVAPSAP